MRIIGNDPNKPRQTAATASGTLPNGKPVVVNSDGTVSAVEISNVSDAVGSSVTFESANSYFIDTAYDAASAKVVICYIDGGNSARGTAVVGTVSGTSISFGSPVIFHNDSTTQSRMVYDANAEKVVIVFQDNSSGSFGQGKAVVGTVSGTSISFGSKVAITSGQTMENFAMAYDANAQKVVIAFRDYSNNNYGGCVVGTVSGTSISFGSKTVYNSATTLKQGMTYDSTAQKIVLAYHDYGATSGNARVGTVSGTSISFGSEATFESAAVDFVNCVYDASADRTVVAYQDSGNSNLITAAVGTVSGTSISFGTPVVFDGAVSTYIGMTYHPVIEKTVIAYQDDGNSGAGTVVTGTVSGTSISFDTPLVFESNGSGGADQEAIAYDSAQDKIVIGYRNLSTNYGTGIVFRAAGQEANLTAENYIGMSQGPVQVFAEGAGSLVEYHSTDTRGNNIAYDAASGKFVAIFNPGPPTSSPPSGYAIVGTVDPSDNSITYGTAVQFESGEVYGDYMGITYDSNAEKVVISYMDTGDSNNSKAIVGTVSGTSISFGTPTTFNGQTQFLTSAFDSTNNKVVIAYKDASNSDYGTAIVGTVSGTSISFGSKVVFNSGNTNNIGICFDSTNDKIIIGYRDQAFQQQATAIVGTVSGTSISFGSEVQVSPNSATDCVPIYDPVAEKVVFVYSDSSDSNKGTVKIGTVSGTSISFGDAVVFDATNYDEGAGVFDANAGKVTIAYKGASGYPYIISGTVSGSTMTFGDPVQLGSFAAAGYRFGCAYDSANFRIVSVFIDSDATPDNGESAVFNNFYEIRPSIADGGNALMDTQGGISDNQSSLTAGQSYYVQTDGTITTTAGDPSVFAGTAVSSTKLIVKG